MSVSRTVGIISLALLTVTLALNTGCDVGGANIRLEGLSLGTITMDGKPVEGLPAQKIDLLLEVSAEEIIVEYAADGTILTLNPSGATVEIKADGITINGITPGQAKVEWAVSEQDRQ